MLFDPKWNPLSLESLIAWLEKQPAQTTYDYQVPDRCLIAQWSGQCLSSFEVDALFGGKGLWIAQGRSGPQYERWTFGAALERARAVLRQSRE